MVHIYTPNGGLAGRKDLYLLFIYTYNRYHMAELEKKFGNLRQVRSGQRRATDMSTEYFDGKEVIGY